jgi:hypothetical protein
LTFSRFLREIFSFWQLALDSEALPTAFEPFGALLVFIAAVKPYDFLNMMGNS